MATVVKIAMRLRADRNRQEDARRRDLQAAELRRQEEQRRREELARRETERRRRRDLLRQSVRLRQATGLTDLIAAVEATADLSLVDADRLADWVAQARQVAESIHPVSAVLKSLEPPNEK